MLLEFPVLVIDELASCTHWTCFSVTSWKFKVTYSPHLTSSVQVGSSPHENKNRGTRRKGFSELKWSSRPARLLRFHRESNAFTFKPATHARGFRTSRITHPDRPNSPCVIQSCRVQLVSLLTDVSSMSLEDNRLKAHCGVCGFLQDTMMSHASVVITVNNPPFILIWTCACCHSDTGGWSLL